MQNFKMVGMKKTDLFELAKERVFTFVQFNPQIPVPTIVVADKLPSYGQACQKTIWINVKKCAVATKTPGFKWSYPGYKADLTPIGVLTHELGHVAHNHIKCDYKKHVMAIRKKEANVSSYEPNIWETVAEATKLFINNPMLLKEGRPFRYEFLINQLGFKPLHELDWRIVLGEAHPKFIEATQRWIKL